MTNEPLKATHTPLPCPFCGGEPRIMERPQSGKDTGFFCSISCFCGKYSTRAHQHGIAETVEAARAEALTAWNTRAVNSHHDLIEALREAREALCNHACHGGKEAPCIRSDDQCRAECGYLAGDAIVRIDAILTKAEAGHG